MTCASAANPRPVRVFSVARTGPLLAGVEQPLRIERALDRLVRADGRLRPLTQQLARLEQSEAVLAADRPAELAREREQLSPAARAREASSVSAGS